MPRMGSDEVEPPFGRRAFVKTKFVRLLRSFGLDRRECFGPHDLYSRLASYKLASARHKTGV